MVVPVAPLLRMGAEVVVAVDVDRGIPHQKSFGNVLEVVIRWAEAASARLKKKDLELADLVARPRVGSAHWSDFQDAGEFIEQGRRVARENLEEIQRLTSPQRWWSLGRLFKA